MAVSGCLLGTCIYVTPCVKNTHGRLHCIDHWACGADCSQHAVRSTARAVLHMPFLKLEEAKGGTAGC
jgi:hypothetical protein